MTSLLAALWLVAADALAAVGAAGVPFDPVAVVRLPVAVGLDWLVDLVERIDRLLEAVADLLETVRRLFGGEAGD